MIFWKGYGFLALVIAVAIGAITAFTFSKLGSTEDLGAAVGAIISGVVIWIVGSRLNSITKERTVVDKKTGNEIILKPNNSLLFIKMQYWGFIVGGIGLIMLADVLIHGKSSF